MTRGSRFVYFEEAYCLPRHISSDFILFEKFENENA